MKKLVIDSFIRKSIFWQILSICFLLIVSDNSWSDSQKLKAAIFDIAPWGYRNNRNQVVGIERDIIHAISKDIGEDIEVVLVPYKRMIKKLEYGDVDFSIFFRSKKSEKAGEPLVKWGALDIIVIGLSGQKIETYNDLKKQRIAVRLGGYFEKRFDNDKELRKVYYTNYEEGVKKLKDRKVSAIVGTAATLHYEFNKQGVTISDLGKPYYLNKREDWLHFSRKSKQTNKKKIIIKSVEKLIADGTFDKLFSKYLPQKWIHQKIK